LKGYTVYCERNFVESVINFNLDSVGGSPRMVHVLGMLSHPLPVVGGKEAELTFQ